MMIVMMIVMTMMMTMMMIVMMASVLAGQVSLHRAPDRIYLAAAICQPSLLAASENLRNVENLAF